MCVHRLLQLTASEVQQLSADPQIREIHSNARVTPFQQQQPPLPSPAPLLQQQSQQPAISQQAQAPWNLNRISHPALPITRDYKYASDGTGVNVYVLDTVRPSTDRPFVCAWPMAGCLLHPESLMPFRLVDREGNSTGPPAVLVFSVR